MKKLWTISLGEDFWDGKNFIRLFNGTPRWFQYKTDAEEEIDKEIFPIFGSAVSTSCEPIMLEINET